MKTLCLFLYIIFNSYLTLAQSSIQIGQRLLVGNQKVEFKNISPDYFFNKGYNYQIDFVKPSTEIDLKLSTLDIKDTSKFKIGYSLEIGYRFAEEELSSFASNFDNLTNAITNTQTVVKKNHLRQIIITNYIEFHYKISEKLIFTNSLGFSFSGSKLKWYSGTLYRPEGYLEGAVQPILKLKYVPQLIVNYNKFSLNFHLYQEVLNISKLYYNEKFPLSLYQPNFHLSTFTGMGIFFMPHIRIISERIDNNE